eukprot:746111-Hanusia_phi.AAC.4
MMRIDAKRGGSREQEGGSRKEEGGRRDLLMLILFLLSFLCRMLMTRVRGTTLIARDTKHMKSVQKNRLHSITATSSILSALPLTSASPSSNTSLLSDSRRPPLLPSTSYPCYLLLPPPVLLPPSPALAPISFPPPSLPRSRAAARPGAGLDNEGEDGVAEVEKREHLRQVSKRASDVVCRVLPVLAERSQDTRRGGGEEEKRRRGGRVKQEDETRGGGGGGEGRKRSRGEEEDLMLYLA